MLSQNLNDIISQDIVIPLDELIAADAAQVKMDDFFPAFMLNSTQGGKVWSIPFQRSTPVMYYNKDAFKEVGLDPNKPPQTQAELVAAAKKLTKQEGGRTTRWGLAIPSSGGVDTWLYEALTIAAGGVLYDVNNSCCKVLLSSPAAETAAQFLRDLGEKEKVSPPGPINWGTTANDFAAGNVAMIYYTTGGLGFIRNNAKFEFGTAFLPKDQRFGTPTGGGNVYLFKATPPDRRKAAWEFAKWITSTGDARPVVDRLGLRRPAEVVLGDAADEGLRRQVPPGDHRARPAPVRARRAAGEEHHRGQARDRHRAPDRADDHPAHRADPGRGAEAGGRDPEVGDPRPAGPHRLAGGSFGASASRDCRR